jgi:hypothetical protein
MARTAIPVQSIPNWGGVLNNITETAADDVNDHEIANEGESVLVFMRNEDASVKTATIVSVGDRFGRDGDETLSANAGAISCAGPFKAELFQQSGGLVHVDIADDTNVTFFALKFSRFR